MKNNVASVQDRLKNAAKAQEIPFQIFLEQFALSRFLARLSQSEHKDQFVLKGAIPNSK